MKADYAQICRAVLRIGMTETEAAKAFGVSKRTIGRALAASNAVAYENVRRISREHPKWDVSSIAQVGHVTLDAAREVLAEDRPFIEQLRNDFRARKEELVAELALVDAVFAVL